MVHTLSFSSSKCSLFHNSNAFCACIIHILYTVCAKIKKKNYSGTKSTAVFLLFTTARQLSLVKAKIFQATPLSHMYFFYIP
jgi:hypothetical protein